MKLRYAIILTTIVLLLSACNFTLAEDVTPPPNYVPPTPAPTMGPLFPANTPNIENGAAIYVEKCLPCHGSTGLGDGPQGKQLPVSVAALGVPDFAQKAKPSDWYLVVTQGNLERFMPPFASLNDQERWDVVTYALTLHTTPDQIAQGKSLFEANCTDCSKSFSSPEMMSGLSENAIIQLIKEGQGDFPAFGKNFTDEEAAAVAAYVRTLTFAPPAAPVAVAATQTPVSAETVIPSAETTPVDGTQAAVTPEAGTPQAQAKATVTVQPTLTAGFGTVSGALDNQTGSPLPSDIRVTLRALEHGADPNTGPAEIAALETTAKPDGTFVFENVEMPENRIFIAEATVNGEAYQSEFGVVTAGMTELVVPTIGIFASSEDFSVLTVDSLQIHFDFANETDVQIFGVYTISNPTDNSIRVKMGDQEAIPFIPFPEGSTALGYEATQDTATFVQTADGFAMPPSKTPYGLIAFASYPKADSIVVSQQVVLPISGVSILLPEGLTAKGDKLSDEGIQTIQSTTYHLYTTGALKKDETLEFTISGKPKDTAVNPDITQNKTLLIGVGAFGVVLILAGIWLFMRDRKRVVEVEEEEEDDEFDDPDSLMDAIIALDDLHRAGKLSDEAYQKRREELKIALKRKS
jgi:mono/diheme cytochrome c family protein